MTTAVAPHAADDPRWVDAVLAVLDAELTAAAARVQGLRSSGDLTRITVPGPPGTRQGAEQSRSVGRDSTTTETGSEGRETRGRNDG